MNDRPTGSCECLFWSRSGPGSLRVALESRLEFAGPPRSRDCTHSALECRTSRHSEMGPCGTAGHTTRRGCEPPASTSAFARVAPPAEAASDVDELSVL
jgi:hypothetical protein